MWVRMSAPASRADWAAQGGGFAAGLRTAVAGDEARRRAFAAAWRHSRLVRFLRLATPAGVAVGAAALLLATLVNPFRAPIGGLAVSDLAVDGLKVTMGKPKLTGVRRDGRAYVVNAAKAIQDVTHPTLVELRDIDGDLGMADNATLHISAATGFYDSVRQSLDLSQDVRIHNSSYDVRLSSANVDFKGGVYRSDQPVTLVMTNGTTIAADSALARDNGTELTFAGHVRSLFTTGDSDEGASAEMKGTKP
jgi:lipopolysaccharide export system protein LptC